MSNTLLNYNWIDISGNTLPIANSTFVYGICSLTTYNSNNQNYWNPLQVTNVYGNNTNLVTKSTDGGLKFNVSGIYLLTNNLLFTGSNFSSSGTVYTFAFSYSDSLNTAGTYPLSSTGTTNSINGPIYFLDGSTNTSLADKPFFINGSCSGGRGNYANGYDSSNYGGNVAAVSTNGASPLANNSPPFFLLTNYSSSSTITNTGNPNLPINTVNAIYYIPAGITIYFNFTNSSGGTNTLNASCNFTAQLLNYILVPSVVSSNLTGTLNYSNGYYYYTFVPTTTTSNGTATITFPTNVAVNYLLVGGGGSGAGGLTNVPLSNYQPGTSWSGGGGGGGQVIPSNSAISGNTFNITVGNAGPSTTASALGVSGGNTILTNGSTSAIALGGGGGQIAPVSAGGTGGGAGGGSGMYVVSSESYTGASIYTQTIQNAPTNGGSGQTINLPFQTYNVGGGGGGGGNTSYYAGYSIAANSPAITIYGGTAGSNSTGGLPGGYTPTQTGQNSVSTSYGAGGGGGGIYLNNSSSQTSYGGGAGGPGFAVLYWKA